MENNKLNNYILFWLSQSVSQLGSSMTSFALIIWAYKQTSSAMSVSLMMFFSYLPYIVASIFAGAFIDFHNKKKIMLWADSIAAICSTLVLLLLFIGRLEIWYIYIVNFVNGLMNAFQSPAEAVVIGIIVPKEKYAKASGMNSFSSSLITVVTPTISVFINTILGLQGVIFVDLLTFIFASGVLIFCINIPEEAKKRADVRQNILSGCKSGITFLLENKGIWYLIISSAIMNFFSRLTYENILSPMILARSGGDDKVLGIVNAIIGIGGIIGGILVSFIKLGQNRLKLIYVSAAFSFLFGDILMGLGQNCYVWCLAAVAASVPIPFIIAGQNVIIYNVIPKEIQGRVFAVKNAVQYFTIPIGILLGGVLSDYVFEPFMCSENKFSLILQKIVGTGTGSGMAVMFLCTGILGFITSIFWHNNRHIRRLEVRDNR